MQLPKRLDKYLRESTSRSLAELRLACATGRVAIHSAARELDFNAATRVAVARNELVHERHRNAATRAALAPDELVFEGDQVEFDGIAVFPRAERDYLAFHKPMGVTTTARDPDGQQDLSPWLRQMPAGVFPVGRLDRMTSGLLLCTNDGDFAYAMLHPLHRVEKCYWLWLDESLDATDPRIANLVQGVAVAGESMPLRASAVSVHHRTESHTELLLWIREGKHRQVRKMCYASNLPLVGLHRQAIGSLELRGLPAGAHRRLLSQELAELWSAAGGQSLVEQRQLTALRQRARSARDANRPLTRLEQWLERRAKANPL